MNVPPRRPADLRVYRTAGTYRRRRLYVGIAAVAVGLLLAGGAWALVAGGSGGSGEPGVAAAGSDQSGGGAGGTPAGDAGTTAGASPGASGSPSPSATSAPAAEITIGWVGDTTPGSKYGNPPDNGRALFAQVRDELRAPDLMIANLEGTYSTGGPSKCDYSDSSLCFAFQAPPSFAGALPWAGIDLVSLANNHSNDYFERGLDQTKKALKKNDIAYAGLPDQVTVVDVKGVKVAVVGFSPYSWNASLIDIPAAKQLVREAVGKADVVVVLMHAGAEGADKIHTPSGTEIAFGENRGDPRGFAHGMVDAGADLVLGSGPHVIRGVERYGNRLIAYSLGNFAGWDNFGLSGNLGLSGLLTITVDEKGHPQKGRWLSLRLAEPGVPVIDSSHTSAHLVDQLSQADFHNTFDMDAEGNIVVD